VRIAVARETARGEGRVALVPEAVPPLVAIGYEVAVATGAGLAALVPDEAYTKVGAVVTEDPYPDASVVVSVQPVRPDLPPPGAATISFFPALDRLGEVAGRLERRLTTFGMELVPRISRAQSMDALSSQSMVAGYRAAIVAASRLRQFFPLSMTAAGTVPPAQVLVLGAGVAGLQAVATCRRLGAVVKGYDVRAAAAEEIRSLGAVAIELGLPTLEGASGYAREMTEERAARQRDLLTPHIAAADVLITTAAVPGRQAPLLVTRAMVEQMRPGSIVVDLAADSGGNVEGVVPGEVVTLGHAQVWGGSNVPSQLSAPASRLYAQNIRNVIALMTRDRAFVPDFADEIVAAMCITHAGQVTHEPTAAALRQAQDTALPQAQDTALRPAAGAMTAREAPGASAP
jgi:NAD(P) transhydrogenase subunit alpha